MKFFTMNPNLNLKNIFWGVGGGGRAGGGSRVSEFV